MKQLAVHYHKDGDHLRISEVPWWSVAYERVVDALFCPCHGLSGLLSKMEWYGELTYRVWNRALNVRWDRERKLIDIPVGSGDEVAKAIWGE